MRIAILGGGVIGMTAAYELQKDGHDIVLVERHPGAAEDTSWGNAGMIAPGHSFAWSSPQAPFILAKSLVQGGQSLRYKPRLSAAQWGWSLAFLRECTEARSTANTRRKFAIASYSQKILQETIAETGIEYDRVARGILYFYRTPARLTAGIAHMKIMEEMGQRIEVLDRDEILELEPALAGVGDQLAGGIYCPTDETGSCNRFSAGLARHIAAKGAELRFGETILKIETKGERVTGVVTDKGRIEADLYVMALGSESRALAGSIGERLRIYPVKGYSLTIPVGNSPLPPSIGAVDEENLVAVSPHGDKVRVTATAEISELDRSFKPSDFTHMARIMRETYRDGALHDEAHHWAGLRPMTPTNLPIIGRKGYRNLYYDTGHGHIGWTMSHGSARILADVIAGREPALALSAINDQGGMNA